MTDELERLRERVESLLPAAADDPCAALQTAGCTALREAAQRLMASRRGGGEDAADPACVLGGIVEALREFELRPADRPDGGLRLHAARAPRKGLGAFYTARALAEATVEHALRPLVAGRALLDLRICDPAMGGGAFLLAALRWIGGEAVRRGESLDPAVIARRCLHGVDVDPLAVEAARLALWVAVGDAQLAAEDVCPGLRAADALFSVAPQAACADPEVTRFERLFAEVFANGGFHAVIGNPPWDIRKPNSREFFGGHDAEYRGRSRRAALARRDELYAADPQLGAAWDREVDGHRRLSQFVRRSGAYRLQGAGDLNAYQLFVERGLDLLAPGGRLALILPSGIHCDKGAEPLRRHLLDHHGFEWLFMFTNRAGIFDIHRSYRFGMVVVEKGGSTAAVRVAFDRHDVADLANAEQFAVAYPRADVERFSPRSSAFLELQDGREREVLERVFAGAQRVADRADLAYRREFDLTLDAPHFVEAQDLDPSAVDEFGCVDHHGELLVPLLQGVMLRSFDCAAAAYRAAAARGTRADWQELDFAHKAVRSRFYVPLALARARARGPLRARLAFRDVQNATNERTFLGAIVPPFPCGNTLPTLTTGDALRDLPVLVLLSSFVVDRVLRLKMSQNHVNRFYLDELPLPVLSQAVTDAIALRAAPLALAGVWFAAEWLRLRERHGLDARPWRGWWATNAAARAAIRADLDAVAACAFGLDRDDLAVLLRDCDLPSARLRRAEGRAALDPKGFWRVDRDLPAPKRHPARALSALDELLSFIAEDGDPQAGMLRFLSRRAPAEPAAGEAWSWAACERVAVRLDDRLR